MSIEQLAQLIRALNAADTARLIRLLGWQPPPTGTREPRRPRTPDLRGGIALDDPQADRKARP